MGVDALLAALLRDADAEATRRRTAAAVEAARLVEAAEARLTAEREGRCREREVALRAATTSQVDATRVEHGRRVLEARERLLGRVRAAAGQGARALFEGEHGGLDEPVRVLVREAQEALPPEDVVLRCAPEWSALLSRISRESGGALRVEADPVIGSGFMAAAQGSGVVVDQRLETRLAQQWPDLAIALVAAIDGPDGTGTGGPGA